MTTNFTGAVQESLLCLLCFREEGRDVARDVPARFFESFYRKIAEKVYEYRNRFNLPPGDHTLDLIDELGQEHPDDHEIYTRIYYSLLAGRDEINAEYVLTKANSFVRQQQMKQAMTESVPLIQNGDLDAAEALLTGAMRTTLQQWNPGTEINDLPTIFRVLQEQIEPFPTGIKQLDERRCGPCRKELSLFIGLPKNGKTWWMIQLGKMALKHHLRVLHVTLEMSEAKMAQRYLQSLFSLSTRAQRLERMVFKADEHGHFTSMALVDIPERPSFADDNIEATVQAMMEPWQGRMRLMIKQFPTGMLTVDGLQKYLDQLEAARNFIPDLILLDYADLMEIDDRYHRESVGRVYKQIRGIGVDRNIAVATASQGGRVGASAKLLRETHVAEDWSKIATADTILTYTRTEPEKKLGLARVHVAGSRNEEDKFTIVVSQNYAIGQFCFDSVRMVSRYDDALQKAASERLGENGYRPRARLNTNGHAR